MSSPAPWLTLTGLALLGLAPRALAAPGELRTALRLSPAPTTLSRTGAPLLAGMPRTQALGKPALPYRELSVALHPRVELSSLRLSWRSASPARFGGQRLEPSPPLRVFDPTRGRWLEPRSLTPAPAREAVVEMDPRAFGERTYPPAAIERRAVSRRGALVLLHLRYWPLRYRHASGELLLDDHTRVELRYRLRPARGDQRRPATQRPPLSPPALGALGRAANAAQARAWYRAASAGANAGYAVVIPDSLRQRSKALEGFIAHKRSLGMQVHLVSDTELAAVPVSPGAGAPERIRGWLQRNHESLGLRYVLLIGNPDPSRPGVPMKLTYPLTGSVLSSSDAPTDHYYADLTGNWDLDGNGRAAEYSADRGDGGVDFAPEVYVGRIPVYDDNVTALDRILRKTIAYASSAGDISWRRRVLQAAAMLFFEGQYGRQTARIDGAGVTDAIFQQVVEAREMPHTSLYEGAGIAPSRIDSDLPLTTANLIDRLGQGYGLVNLVGHGSAAGIFRLVWNKDNGDNVPDYGEVSTPPFLVYDDAAKLDNQRPAMVFHASCANATPERPDNLAYGLLRRGAVGTISSTRVVLVVLTTGHTASQNIFGISREFTRRLLDGASIGEALFEAKLDIGDDLGQLAWFTRLEINLYGDPSLRLVRCGDDDSCDDGDRCNGLERCIAGQCEPGVPVTCTSSDPCVEARCDAESGACLASQRPEDEPCDDRQFCTVDDRCRAGRCAGEPRCAAPRNPCVRAICDERTRSCDVFVPLESEERACHVGGDRQGFCRAGVCVAEGGGCSVEAPSRSTAGESLPDAAPAGWLLLLLAAGWLSRRRG